MIAEDGVTCRNYAKFADLDYELLRALANDGYLPSTGSNRQREPLISRQFHITEPQLILVGRLAYEDALKAYAQTARKMRAELNDVISDSEEAIATGINPVTELGVTLQSMLRNRERWGFDQLRSDLDMCWFHVSRYQQILWNLDSSLRLTEVAAAWRGVDE